MPAKNRADIKGAASSGIDYLFSDVQYLKGVGPRKAEVLAQNGIATIFDLFLYVPRRYVDHSQITAMKDVREGEDVTVLGKVSAAGSYIRHWVSCGHPSISEPSGSKQ